MRLSDSFQPYPLNLLEVITDQSFVIRYSKVHVIRHQTDADHIGRSAQIAICVLNDIRSNSNVYLPMLYSRVLTGIVLHDTGESIVGDVTSDIKQDFPQFDQFEDQLVSRLWDNVVPEPAKMDSIAYKVMKAVDIAELVCYCTDEVGMGNCSKTLVACLISGLATLQDAISGFRDMFRTTPVTLLAIVQKGKEALDQCSQSNRK